MNLIKKNYFDKNLNLIIEKIKNNDLKEKDLEDYLIHKNKDNNSKNIFKEIIEIINKNNNNIILKNSEILEEIKELSKYLDKKTSKYIISYICGYKQLTNVIEDDDIEEIMINNYDEIFIINRNSEKFITDISFSYDEFNDFLNIIKKTLNTDFTKRPFIDGVLPNTSRINIISKSISLFNTITIRKFTQKPLTIIDLIKNNTLDSDMAAFLWTIVDGFSIKPANIFICGGTSCGKTTFLNTLLDFINPNSRIVLIEDTREINLDAFKDSVSLVSDITNPDSLFDITKNALRMRPDRIIIGEVRGVEAQGLFSAMNTGHQGCMATLHSNNSHDVVKKLISKPIEIAEVNINLLNIIIMLDRKIRNNSVERHISEISEIQRMGNININKLYEIDNPQQEDKIKIMHSSFLEKISNILNISKKDIQNIIYYRSELLNSFLINNNNFSNEEFRNYINTVPNYKEILNRINNNK